MTGTLVVTAMLMGLAGTPHCAGMCSAGCTAAIRLCEPLPASRARLALLAGRVLGYAAAGAAVAAFAQVLRWSSATVQWLHPIWFMLQLAMVLIGMFLLVRGRLPDRLVDWAAHWGRAGRPGDTVRIWLPGEVKAVGLGALWAALPCGLLHAALLLAALASSPWEGGLVMASFALASLPGLLAGAMVWRFVARVTPMGPERATRLSLRLAGAGIVAVAAWPALHAVGAPLVAAWCA